MARGIALRLLTWAAEEVIGIIEAFLDGWLYGIDGVRRQWETSA